MTGYVPHRASSAAEQLLAIEVFTEMLATTDPAELCPRITEQIRELTGARTVMLVAHIGDNEEHKILHTSPMRRKNLFTPVDHKAFCPVYIKEHPDFLTIRIPQEHPWKEPLLRNNIKTFIRVPLKMGKDPSAMLLLMDLPEPDRIHESFDILNLLSSIIAIALQNSFSHNNLVNQARNLEALVEKQTHHLTSANQELAQSRLEALKLMEDAILDRKRIEQAMIDLQKESEERKKSEIARKQTEEILRNTQKLESLGLLAGGIAHDFNNLLGGIFGYIDLAIEMCHEKNVSEYLSRAMSAIDRARGLTGQLLTFSKGGSPITKTEDLKTFITDTVKFALSGSNVSSRFSIDDNLWLCDVDKNQIGQVIDNIVINAQQATPGGGSIDFSAENIVLSYCKHATLSDGNYVKLAIRDYGIGMPEDILPKIFDPFFTTKAKGHGLGLATCFSIIKRHGGIIEVRSEPGNGTTFCIYLPATLSNHTDRQDTKKGSHKGTGLFLVMDDQDLMRDTLGSMLESFGYTVILKENGEETIEYFTGNISENNTLKGMIFDLTIPGGRGGKETIAEIRKHNSAIPVFVISGYADDPVMANPEKFGFTACIRKPLRKHELAELLNKYIQYE
jgi:signal transduction histidine kinase/ActR/RegA family two-component response regulator